jgi:L-asparaginase II
VPESYAELARVLRSGFIESRHFGSLTALNPDGSVALSLGSPVEPILPRSTFKPLQALGVLRAGTKLTEPQLAVAIGSHVGADEHLAATRSILTDFELSESDLACPADYPEDSAARERMIRAGVSKQPICMNCSGKHAAMLAACATNGWPTSNYLDPGHPLQLLIRDTVAELSGVTVEVVAVDGCGAPLFSTSVAGVASAFRSLARAAAGTLEHSVSQAMRNYPELIGGVGHANTVAMQRFAGSIAKGGAEGVFGMATADGASVGIKVIDGGLRATTVIALAALEKIGALPAGPLLAAPELAVMVYGGGREVGSIEPGPLLGE